MRPVFLLFLISLTAGACGGGSPAAPPTPTPTATPADTHTVVVVLFEDENGNGRRDDFESTWLPEVEVEISGRTGRSEPRTGRAVVTGVVRGTYPVVVKASSLPPYYASASAVTADSPPVSGAPVYVPVVLPVGRNNRGTYFLSGDSISQGESSTNGTGFRVPLRNELEAHFGRATVVYRGGGGGTTADGVLRLERDLGGILPAFTVLMWGVNDWNITACSVPSDPMCLIATNIRTMIRLVRTYDSLPCVATITPSNTGFANGQAPPERNVWVRRVNDIIRAVAKEERVLLIDVGDAFFKEPDLSRLFVDHVHPNDAGYDIIARTYFQALTHGAVAASVGTVPMLVPPLDSGLPPRLR